MLNNVQAPRLVKSLEPQSRDGAAPPIGIDDAANHGAISGPPQEKALPVETTLSTLPIVEQAVNRRQTHWEPHPMALLFPPKTPEEQEELKVNMVERVQHGLDPLEHPLLLYEGKLFDGVHRDKAWNCLADEDACGGFFRRNLPPTEAFSSDKHGTLGVWLRAKSLNMVHRHIPADQKAAIFLKAVETFPELKAALEDVKDENAKRQKEGKPLVAGDQRCNTTQQIAQMAGTGATTIKQVKRLQAEAPDKFEEVAQGKTTAKKALREIKKARGQEPPERNGQKPQSAPEFKPSDLIYVVESIGHSTPQIHEWKVTSVKDDGYICTDGRRAKGKRIVKRYALTLNQAKQEWKRELQEKITIEEEGVKELKDMLKMPPKIERFGEKPSPK